MIKLRIDDRDIEAEAGQNLLKTCLDNGIYVPNLCYLDNKSACAGSCRLCFVEIDGREKPAAACTLAIDAGMAVRTDTAAVRRLQKSALRLLLSVHDADCRRCPVNRKCDLQRIARFLKIALKPKGLEQKLKDPAVVSIHPNLNYYPNRCILCGKCIEICRRRHGRPLLTFSGRGFDTVISGFGSDEMQEARCEACRACLSICPVAALMPKNGPPFRG